MTEAGTRVTRQSPMHSTIGTRNMFKMQGDSTESASGKRSRQGGVIDEQLIEMKELQRVQTEMINKMIQQNKLMYDQLQ